MHPELFEIPFLHISVKSYGTLMVIGFLAALWIMRRLMRGAGQDPDRISSIAMYALLCGIIQTAQAVVSGYPCHWFDGRSGVWAFGMFDERLLLRQMH